MPDVTVPQTYTTTYINAFPDDYSLRTNTNCGIRTCTSDHPNVIWDDPTQKFAIQSLGASDVVGTKTAVLTCSIFDNDQVPEVTT